MKRFTEDALSIIDNRDGKEYDIITDKGVASVVGLMNELDETTEKLLHIIDWCLQHHREIYGRVFNSRDEFFIWLHDKGVI